MQIANRHALDRWPERAVYVGRPSPLGNPYRIGVDGSREEVIRRYRAHLEAAIERGDQDVVDMLRGLREDSVLVCHCAPRPCHAEVIREIWRQRFAERPLVFVFGSNLAGRHGAGAARAARERFAARPGVGAGPTGSAWAIPTKDERLQTLPIETIARYVREFVEAARATPNTEYRVTDVGCGLAGYEPEDVAPMFAAAPECCRFSEAFRKAGAGALARYPVRLVVCGSRSATEPAATAERLDRVTATLERHRMVLVHGDALGVDRHADAWAQANAIPVWAQPARWSVTTTPGAVIRRRSDGTAYNARAGIDRNARLAAIATHAVAIWDGKSPGTRAMIALLRSFAIPSRVLRLRNSERPGCGLDGLQQPPTREAHPQCHPDPESTTMAR